MSDTIVPVPICYLPGRAPLTIHTPSAMLTKMSYDYKSRKIAAALSAALDPATALRVLGHLGTALGAHATSELLGRHTLLDGLGNKHRGIARYPVIVLRAKATQLAAAIESARHAPVLLVDFTTEMLNTGHDDDLVSLLAKQSQVEYLGFIVYGPTAEVDTVTRRLSLWRYGP